jgi:predicted CoA-binding protein
MKRHYRTLERWVKVKLKHLTAYSFNLFLGVENLNHEDLREILRKYKTVAIVGLSRDPSKDSYRVAEYLKKFGFHVVPVNPSADEILGEKSHKSLLDMPVEVQKSLEIIDIFRPSTEVPLIVEQAVQLKTLHGVPHVIWIQLGIINEQAAATARRAGLSVVMDKCMMQEHRRLFASGAD